METFPVQFVSALGLSRVPDWTEWDDILAIGLAFLILFIFVLDTRFPSKDPYHHLWFERPQGSLSSHKAVKESNIARALEAQGKYIVIFFGSQSGTSERLARRLGRDLDKRFSKTVLIADFSDYDCNTITQIASNKLTLFLLSTYGEGDPPDNAMNFDKWLETVNEVDSLSDLRFAILGLGNSNYKFYNRFAQKTYDILKSAGASSLLGLHLADDALGLTDEDFCTWKEALYRKFVTDLGFKEHLRKYEPSILIENHEASDASSVMYWPVHDFRRKANAGTTQVYETPIITVRSLSPRSSRTNLQVDIDISQHPQFKYSVGDHLAIWPENPETEIERLCEALDVSKTHIHQPLAISPTDPDLKLTWPHPVSLHALLRRHMDIAGLVPRQFILDLIQFAPSSSAKEALKYLAKDSATYAELCSARRLTIASVLQLASPTEPWQIPLSFLLENVPPLRPRYYSISSAASVNPNQISLTVTVMRLQLHDDEVVRGLASNYLLDKEEHVLQASTLIENQKAAANGVAGNSVWCHVRRSKFKPPVSAMQSIVMVATGSGIAPFRGFLQHRLRQFQVKGDVGSMLLFFGCRDQTEHLYKEEIDEFQTAFGGRLAVITTYSRNGEGYVQDRIRKEQEKVLDMLLGHRAHLYICGSTRMARGVKEELKAMIQQHEVWSMVEADEFETAQVKSRKWQLDVWG